MWPLFLAKDVTVSTGGADGIVKFLLSPTFLGPAIVCGVAAFAVRAIFNSLPKWVLILLVFTTLIGIGALKLG